jgi:hypothetical protein
MNPLEELLLIAYVFLRAEFWKYEFGKFTWDLVLVATQQTPKFNLI